MSNNLLFYWGILQINNSIDIGSVFKNLLNTLLNKLNVDCFLGTYAFIKNIFVFDFDSSRNIQQGANINFKLLVIKTMMR